MKNKIYYECWCNLEATDKSTVEYIEWHVTSENKNGIYLRRKSYFTWGRLSKKTNDYGWLPNSDPFYRKVLKDNEDYKNHGLHLTKKSAYKSVLPELKKYKRDILRLITLVEKEVKKESNKKITKYNKT